MIFNLHAKRHPLNPADLCIFSRLLFVFYSFLYSTRFLAVGPYSLTLTTNLTTDSYTLDAHKHTLKKELQEKAEADYIMQISVACRDVHGIKK